MRLVPRHLIDGLTLCYSWRCYFVVLKMSLALRALLRLEWHFFTTGVSGFEAKLRLVRDAVRNYLARPFLTLPKPSTA
jgi:hypothetical protein